VRLARSRMAVARVAGREATEAPFHDRARARRVRCGDARAARWTDRRRLGRRDGGRATHNRTAVFSVGARDVALGAGTLVALRQGGALRPWLFGALLADAADFVATFAAGKAIPAQGRAAIALIAGGAVAGQLAVARSLEA
jgi:hypothetical protein